MSLLVLPLAIGCDLPPNTYREVLPDDQLLVELSDLSPQARSVGDPSQYHGLTHDLLAERNLGLGAVLLLIETITLFPPSWADTTHETAQWGPWIENGRYGKLWVQALPEGAYTWAIDMRPEDGDEDIWTSVLVGDIDPGATGVQSTGSMVVDFTSLEALGASEGLTGSMTVDYASSPEVTSTTVMFSDLVAFDSTIPDGSGTHVDYTPGQGGVMDVVVQLDVTDDGSEERATLRSRWDLSGSGRTDALLTGGDLGDRTFTETECWGPTHTVVYYAQHLRPARRWRALRLRLPRGQLQRVTSGVRPALAVERRWRGSRPRGAWLPWDDNEGARERQNRGRQRPAANRPAQQGEAQRGGPWP